MKEGLEPCNMIAEKQTLRACKKGVISYDQTDRNEGQLRYQPAKHKRNRPDSTTHRGRTMYNIAWYTPADNN